MPDFGSTDWYDKLAAELDSAAYEVSPQRTLRCAPSREEIDFSNDRPLSNFASDELVALAQNGLAQEWWALELPTLALEEAMHRRQRVQTRIEEAFQSKDIRPIPWLSEARRALRSAGLRSGPGGAVSSVYFVLVDGFTDANGTYGVYVGSTSTPERVAGSQQAARIAQHFSGVRASGVVRDRGIEPLWSLNFFTKKILARQRLEIETRAHRALEQAVHHVRGDVQD